MKTPVLLRRLFKGDNGIYCPLSVLIICKHPTTFLPLLTTGEVYFSGSSSQESPRILLQQPTREQERSNERDSERGSSESTMGNSTECILITRKFRTTKLNDH